MHSAWLRTEPPSWQSSAARALPATITMASTSLMASTRDPERMVGDRIAERGFGDGYCRPRGRRGTRGQMTALQSRRVGHLGFPLMLAFLLSPARAGVTDCTGIWRFEVVHIAPDGDKVLSADSWLSRAPVRLDPGKVLKLSTTLPLPRCKRGSYMVELVYSTVSPAAAQPAAEVQRI